MRLLSSEKGWRYCHVADETTANRSLEQVRCDATADDGTVKTCSNCQRVEETCTFSRIPMKRGPSKGYEEPESCCGVFANGAAQVHQGTFRARAASRISNGHVWWSWRPSVLDGCKFSNGTLSGFRFLPR